MTTPDARLMRFLYVLRRDYDAWVRDGHTVDEMIEMIIVDHLERENEFARVFIDPDLRKWALEMSRRIQGTA